jgi:glutamine amidotransferase
LVNAENALVWQSEFHPDGWGVAYYVGGHPHVIKSAATAIHDSLFRRVSGIVSSHTVIAHLRKATQGQTSLINTHPFQYGSWIFAHNGDIPRFHERRGALMARISPVLRRFILGDTDSEVFFYILLGHLSERLGEDALTLHGRGVSLQAVADAARAAVAEVEQVVGLSCVEGKPGDAERLLLSFVLTNGEVMLGHHGGKELYCSTHKVCCPERDTCPSFAPMCEQPAESGAVNHIIFSSEVLHGDNVWREMSAGQIVGVDGRMQIGRFH